MPYNIISHLENLPPVFLSPSVFQSAIEILAFQILIKTSKSVLFHAAKNTFHKFYNIVIDKRLI